MPYPGQFDSSGELKQQAAMLTPVVEETSAVEQRSVVADKEELQETLSVIHKKASSAFSDSVAERSVLNKPVNRKLSGTTTLGIIQPDEKNSGLGDESVVITSENAFTLEEVKKVWLDYAAEVRESGKDRLNACLTSARIYLKDSHSIVAVINTAQQNIMEAEKESLLNRLRLKLQNGKMSLEISVAEVRKVNSGDSKSAFEVMAAKNPALNKLRDLLGLDLEY